MKTGDVVILTAVEIELSRAIGKSIALWCAYRGRWVNQRSDKQQCQSEVQAEGIAAEIAFCKATNAPLDLRIDVRPDYDTIYQGWRLDIKAMSFQGPSLKYLVSKQQLDRHASCDGYAFFNGKIPEFIFAGYIGRPRMAAMPMVDLGFGLNYAANPEELFCWELASKAEKLIPPADDELPDPWE